MFSSRARTRELARFGAFALAAATAWGASAAAQVLTTVPPNLEGVYQAVPDGVMLPNGLKNAGSPAGIPLLPAAAARLRSQGTKTDPASLCQPIGPFRMMARASTKIEVIPALAHGRIMMLFEDIAHGHMRLIFTDRGVPAQPPPAWNGFSVGRWERDTLVVETVGFNDQTWLNDAGAPHSTHLRLTERIRPVAGGRYLEYVVTATDPEVLAAPYSYTRYYEKVDAEIQEDICEIAF